MPLTDVSTVTVTARYRRPDGTAAAGTVTFTPSARLVNTDDNEIVAPTPITVDLDGDGRITVTLPATDDLDLQPEGWTWLVSERIAGDRRSFSMALPTSPATVDLADVAPIDPVTPGAVYVLASEVTDNLTAETEAREAHEAATTNVHGIADTAQLVTTLTLTELVQDIVGNFVEDGALVAFTYDDAGNVLTATVTGLTSANVTDFAEAVRDRLAATLAAGPNVTVTVDDPGDTLTIGLTGVATTVQLDAELDAERDAREDADEGLQASIDALPIGTLVAADTALAQGITDEATARAAGDSALDTRLDAIEGLGPLATDAEVAAAVAAEAAARAAAVSALNVLPLIATGIAATDTAALQAAIVSGASVRLYGDFVVNAALNVGVTDLHLWALPGQATITNLTNTQIFLVQNASKITFDGLHLIGSDNPAHTTNVGIAIVHTCSDITVRNCEIASMGYDGIYALRSTDGLTIVGNYVHGCNDDGINPGGGGGAGATHNVTVAHNRVRDCTHDGIHVSVQSENATFVGNVIEGCDAGFGFYDTAQATVTGNTIVGCVYGFRTESGHGSTDITLIGNLVDTCTRGVNVITGHTRWKILGNTFIDCTDYGVVFSYGSGTNTDADSLVANNSFVGGCASAAVFGSALSNLDINSNRFTNITGHAISTGSGVGTFAANITTLDNRFKSITGSKWNIGTGSTVTRRNGKALALMPSGAIAETVDRTTTISADSASLVSGRLTMVAIYLEAGDVVTSISFVSGATPLAVGSNQWFALYSAARVKLAVTADDTSTAWAASAVKTLALTSPYTVPVSGLYYLGICVVASTVPTLRASAMSSPIATTAPILQGASTSALTNPASAPDPAGALTAQANRPYAYVS